MITTTKTTASRRDRLVCWTSLTAVRRLAAVLRQELGVPCRLERDGAEARLYVAETDHRLAAAAFAGYQLGRAR